MDNQQQTASSLLEDFIKGYNAELEVHDDLKDDHIQLQEIYDQQSSLVVLLNGNIEALKHDKVQTAADIKLMQAALDAAEKMSNQFTAQRQQIEKSKVMIKDLQQSITEMKSGGDPKRQREQIKRLKEKNEQHKKRIKGADGALKEAKNLANRQEQKIIEMQSAMLALKQKLSFAEGCALFNKGDHHLLYWPDKQTLKREDGTTFDSAMLLYMHQSGRGGLVSFDPESKTAHLCSSPKGGLRIPKDVVDFSQQWLYQVNELQDGEVKPENMSAVNYNGDQFYE